MKKHTTARGITEFLRGTTAIVSAVILCLSVGSCKSEPTPEHRNLEETSSVDDGNKKEMNSLNTGTPDSQIKAEEIKKKDVILHKTKAQYAIY